MCRCLYCYKPLKEGEKNCFADGELSYITQRIDRTADGRKLPMEGMYTLSPTYDQVSTKLVMPEDPDELALPVNGFQKKILPMDFAQAMETTGVSKKVVERILKLFTKFTDKWNECIDVSFISETQKEAYKAMIKKHVESLAD